MESTEAITNSLKRKTEEESTEEKKDEQPTKKSRHRAESNEAQKEGFELFPNEVLVNIFSKTESNFQQELTQLALVAKHWHENTRNESLLKIALSKLSDKDILELFARTANNFKKILEINQMEIKNEKDEEEFQAKCSDFYSEIFPSLQKKIEILLLDPRISINTSTNTKFAEWENTLCHIAAETNLIEMFNWVHKLGADINARNKHGRTPLHTALDISVTGGFATLEVARKLLENDVDINPKTDRDETPLHFLADFRDRDKLSETGIEDFKQFLDELLDKGANFLATENEKDNAPWQTAAYFTGDLELTKWFIAATEKYMAKQAEITHVSNPSM